MKIAVIGTGYVGLVTGTCFAETGNKVTCVDIDKAKVEKLSGGQITIYEPGLEKIFLRNIKERRLNFTTQLEEAIVDAEIIFLALPTPPGADGSADLKYVLGVADHLGKILKNYKVIVNKSTVPVGTADKVSAAIAANYKGEYDVVSNPEFLREGVAVDDFMKPDRVVVGTKSERAKKLMSDLYAPFVRQGNPVIFMDERSSELTKYAANSFLATKISFMNEVANICELVGADVNKVRIGIGSDSRIGYSFIYPGSGYGGSCFPKDVKALRKTALENGYDARLIGAVEAVNESQKMVIAKKVVARFGADLSGKTFAVWGLAFKPETDDMREAPAIYIIKDLVKRGAKIQAFDPKAMEEAQHYYLKDTPNVRYTTNKYEALENAHAMILLTEWKTFRAPDFDAIKTALQDPIVFDGRNQYSDIEMQKRGFEYYQIGKK